MGSESPKMPLSSEEMARIQKERALSDAQFINGGADYSFDEKGSSRLELTGSQMSKIEDFEGIHHFESQYKFEDLSEKEKAVIKMMDAVLTLYAHSPLDHAEKEDRERQDKMYIAYRYETFVKDVTTKRLMKNLEIVFDDLRDNPESKAMAKIAELDIRLWDLANFYSDKFKELESKKG